ncbi:ABC-2 type transport system ATP-binding protein [Isoptericola variabilis J7]|uniref:ABC transporter ATP-binding protein n=1 Tax=Isoptericola variabilis TaxID=139208 RepID=UPI0011AC4BBB|nr:ABC transporter ATP-binding protein [Isoptericola variabilis]TWH31553.1 ABC-2 type transport system ATP-binding protein [Isoptericola variabilis J7]
MTAEPIVSVRGARRRYGDFEAVRGVDLDVHRGELVALLGTNGAGKTSLVELAEGLAPADAGEVRVLGRDPYLERHLVVPRVGIMLQEAGFSSDLTTAETVGMWAGTLSRPRPTAEVLAAVGLAHRADVRVGSLSGGERRRLDLALAILGDPEVLFLDEPTTGLDPESRQATWRLVRGLLADGVTVLLTTHYLEEAEALADRIAIMQAGRIVREGTVAEVTAAEPARIEFAPRDAAGRPVALAPADLPPVRRASSADACASAPSGSRTTWRPCWRGPADAACGCTSSRHARRRSNRPSSPWPTAPWPATRPTIRR